MSLNTGSIDLIKTKSGDYVFLEVNPVGQFSMVSFPCKTFKKRYGFNIETIPQI